MTGLTTEQVAERYRRERAELHAELLAAQQIIAALLVEAGGSVLIRDSTMALLDADAVLQRDDSPPNGTRYSVRSARETPC